MGIIASKIPIAQVEIFLTKIDSHGITTRNKIVLKNDEEDEYAPKRRPREQGTVKTLHTRRHGMDLRVARRTFYQPLACAGVATVIWAK